MVMVRVVGNVSDGEGGIVVMVREMGNVSDGEGDVGDGMVRVIEYKS